MGEKRDIMAVMHPDLTIRREILLGKYGRLIQKTHFKHLKNISKE